jgi:nucleotide-binding universal stress UspA family protein
LTTVTTAAPSGEFLSIVVGYDGSPPASRALDAAVRLLRGRAGRIEVVWVAHLSSTVMMSAGAVAEMEESFDQLAPEVRDQAAAQLDGSALDWGFERRQGIIADELIAAAAGFQMPARPDRGDRWSGARPTSRTVWVGSVTVSLARRSHRPRRDRAVGQPHPSGTSFPACALPRLAFPGAPLRACLPLPAYSSARLRK